jgi:hypothetical protein
LFGGDFYRSSEIPESTRISGFFENPLLLPVTMSAFEGTLACIKTELGGRCCEPELIVCVAARLAWSEVAITPEVALLAARPGASIKVVFPTKV